MTASPPPSSPAERAMDIAQSEHPAAKLAQWLADELFDGEWREFKTLSFVREMMEPRISAVIQALLTSPGKEQAVEAMAQWLMSDDTAYEIAPDAARRAATAMFEAGKSAIVAWRHDAGGHKMVKP